MEISTYELVNRCRSASIAWGQVPSPPLDAMQLKESRESIDDSLPDLLIDLYSSVGNGGFGPQGGLLGLQGGFVGSDSQMTIVELYREFMWESPEEENWDWPAELLPIAEGGCGLVYCIDLDSTDANIHLLDPNGYEPEDSVYDYVQDCHSTLYEWLDAWSLTRPTIRTVATNVSGSLISRLIKRFRKHDRI